MREEKKRKNYVFGAFGSLLTLPFKETRYNNCSQNTAFVKKELKEKEITLFETDKSGKFAV